MDKMIFSRYGITTNSQEIINSITNLGVAVFHTSEIHIKPFICRKSVCNLADIIAVFKRSERFYIVGIEIKEWSAVVHPKLARQYLQTYRDTCEYFYLAAKRFSDATFEIEDIGLFDLNTMKVVKEPAYLFPDPDFRGHLMKRIKKHYQVLSGVVEDPFQRTLLEFKVGDV